MELARYGTYQEYKQELDTELRKTAEAFVKIGYLLKVAKDTDILKESGYANVYDFAYAEYKIDKSQVSRFININDRFSEGGYSDRLKEQFKGFGHAKLAIMLQLPNEINEELTPEFSKNEILILKEEYEEEKKITDLEILMEGEDAEQCFMTSNLHKALHQLLKDDPQLYVKLHGNIEKGEGAIQDIMAPDGEKIYSIRIQGVGRMVLSVKGVEEPITLTNMRTSEKESFSWGEATEYLGLLMKKESEPEVSWSETYGEEFPKKPEVAPVQLPAERKKEAPRKEAKVQKAKRPEENREPEREPEEQIPGQDNIMEHPEYLPEEMKQSLENQHGSSPSEEQPVENITQNAEIVETTPLEEQKTTINTKWEEVSGSPAAIMEPEDLEDIWDRMELNAAKLNLLIQDYKGRYDEVSKERLRAAHTNAIDLAADLERILNHG